MLTCGTCGNVSPKIQHPLDGRQQQFCDQQCLNLSWLKTKSNVIKMLVLRIVDGDTIKAKSIEDSTIHTIRFLKIDAPESKQTFGKESKEYLSSLIPVGSEISVVISKKDKYRRDLGLVFDENGLNINYQMVKTGHAWYYDDFDKKKNKTLINYQKNAENKMLGLWKEFPHIKPQVFRKMRKRQNF